MTTSIQIPRATPAPEPVIDGYGRTVSYMRFSVTDRCNLACGYCRSADTGFIPHARILTYEELVFLAQLGAEDLGVSKLRLTGGEPFARKGFMDFLGTLRTTCPNLDLRITTNATLIGQGDITRLKKLGVTRLNISLDALDRDLYAEITGRDAYETVLGVVHGCLDAGIAVKINAVAMKGVNDNQLPAFLEFARKHPVDVRFIEFMPMGEGTSWDASRHWSAAEILAQAAQHATLVPVARSTCQSGPANVHAIEGGKGRLGVISPLSNHFCATCNRLRITSDGRLRTCLFSDKEYGLRGLMRSSLDRETIRRQVLRTIRTAAKIKPMGHELLAKRTRAGVAAKRMNAIGG